MLTLIITDAQGREVDRRSTNGFYGSVRHDYFSYILRSEFGVDYDECNFVEADDPDPDVYYEIIMAGSQQIGRLYYDVPPSAPAKDRVS